MRRDDRRNRETVTVQTCIERDGAAGNRAAFDAEHEAAQRDAEAGAERRPPQAVDESRVRVRESIRRRGARTRNGISTTRIEPISRRRVPVTIAADARDRPVHVPEDIGCARFRGRGDAEEGRGDHQGRAGENSTRMTPVWHKRNWWGRSRGDDLIPSLIPVPSFQQ